MDFPSLSNAVIKRLAFFAILIIMAVAVVVFADSWSSKIVAILTVALAALSTYFTLREARPTEDTPAEKPIPFTPPKQSVITSIPVPRRDTQTGRDTQTKHLVFDDFASDSAVMREVALPKVEVMRRADIEVQGTKSVPVPAQGKMTSFAEELTVTLPDRETRQQLPKRNVQQYSSRSQHESPAVWGPHGDFNELVTTTLAIIREAFATHTAAFFWTKFESGELVLEAKLSESAHFSPARKFPMETDAVSRVATKGTLERITEIPSNAEADVLPYYTEPEGVRSFLGIPVTYKNSVVGVLVVDALDKDAFTREMERHLSRFAVLMGGFVENYIEKYDLRASRAVLEARDKLERLIVPPPRLGKAKMDFTPEAITQSLALSAMEIVEWEWLTVVNYDESKRKWVTMLVHGKHSLPYIAPQSEVKLKGTVVGDVITSGVSQNISDASSVLRFETEELVATGSFLCVPITSLTKCYGALAVEHRAKNHFAEQDEMHLSHLARSAGFALELIHLNRAASDHMMADELTGALNHKAYLSRLDEEITRASDFNSPLSCVLFSIDAADKLKGRIAHNETDEVILSVYRNIKRVMRTYDALARYDDHTFAVALVGTPDEDAFLWAEKIRKEIAGNVLTFGKKSFSVTTSIGICGLRSDHTHVAMINGALEAVLRARDKGGNVIAVY